MSSVQVPVVVPLIVVALQQSVTDQSAYVRRAVAHAIPKVFSVDPSVGEELVDLVAKLLKDPDFLCVQALFCLSYAICPDRYDLLHPVYRQVVKFLPDFDEWGQAMILQILLRYARTQFVCPWTDNDDPNGDQKVETNDEDMFTIPSAPKQIDVLDTIDSNDTDVDPDLRALFNTAALLLVSANAAVVASATAIFFYLAPKDEARQCAKALIGHLRRPKEISFAVLSQCTTMAAQRPEMFRPFLKKFFIFDADPPQCKELKLDILTRLALPSNVISILRELLSYTRFADSCFVIASIEAIGRLAVQHPQITENCLRGLMQLLKSRDVQIVASSVVVIRRLLGSHKGQKHGSVVKHLVKLLDETAVPHARASIVWIIGEYLAEIPQLAPDALRKMARTFRDEADDVKLQTLTLAVKLLLFDPSQKKVMLLFKFILDLCKYDLNYDIRDRARLIRLVFLAKKKSSQEDDSQSLALSSPEADSFRAQMQQFFLCEKPVPVSLSKFEGHQRYLLGTLSHILARPARGYRPLPDFPAEAPDPSVRAPIVDESASTSVVAPVKPFSWSDEDESGSEKSGGFFTTEDEANSSATEESSTEDEGSSTEEESEESEEESESDASSVESDDSDRRLRSRHRKSTCTDADLDEFEVLVR
eukprot:GABV01000055.1.p1 GENE.GABV01000055.1~~GABV01000055.1.p1  ORF type:complete len:648 (+),score=165.11 GABV01000055.1:409-2352(+)